MSASAVLGGYLGASVARRVRPSVVRWVAVGIGFVLSAYFFYKRFGPGPTP